MIDIEARKKVAEVARRFVAGQISNFEFESKFLPSQDPAIWAIEDTLWCFYDDFEEHHLKGKWRVPAETPKPIDSLQQRNSNNGHCRRILITSTRGN